MTSRTQPILAVSKLRSAALALMAMFTVANVQGETPLATAPFTSEDKVNALPNVMFVLDDSSSMAWDFLPDWADPDPNGTASPGTGYPDSQPEWRFRNSSYNGLAYDPAIRYRPPAMFDSSGARESTTYPPMTGQSVATGGDATASAASPNWKAVQVDGFKVQANAVANIDGGAYYYYTLAGEWCSDERLRSCSATQSATYNKDAKLRWCKTSADALATTAAAGTNCHAVNIAANAGGVPTYTFARTPHPSFSTITFSSGGTVSNLTVDLGAGAMRITSANATGGSDVSLATAVAAQINACKTSMPGGSLCQVVGFRATSLNNVVTVYAPQKTTATPVVTGVAATVNAFASSSSAPGEIRMVAIHSGNNSYTLPGSTKKGPNRTDCVDENICTYAEEMANYANWYAYYRTRMQAMKSSASNAFAGVSNKFRVGYYSVNNGTGSDFINVNTFTGTHKHDWYTRFLLAKPFGATPTRGALAAMGRMYANKQPYVHVGNHPNAATGMGFSGLAVTDPMQYSCQQNYTILSTDGYWTNEQSKQYSVGETDPNNFTLTDVVPQTLAGDYSVGPDGPDTDGKVIGQQDGSEPRPYYDGAKYTRTETRITEKLEQMGTNVFTRFERRLQRQTQEQPLTQAVTTTVTYPKTLKSWQLETRTTPLNRTEYALQQKVYPLNAQKRDLVESVYRIRSETRPLERYTYDLIDTTYTLQRRERLIDKYVSALQKNEEKINKRTYQLQQAEIKMASATTKLRRHIQPVKSTTWDLQETVTEIKKTTYALEKKNYKLTATDFQLQKRSEVSTNGGETWVSTGWVNVTSGTCEVRASGPGYTRNTECRYTSTTTPGLNSCTNTASVSPGPTTYTVLTSRQCSYETTPASTTATASCTRDDKETSSPYTDYSTCSYNTSGSVDNDQTTCTANDQALANPATWTGNKVTCAYMPSAKAPASVANCTATTTNTAAAVQRTCAYKGTANTATWPSSCTNRDQSGNAAGTLWSGNKTVCEYDTTKNARTFEASCTPADPGGAYNADKVVCSYSNDLVSNTAGTYGTYTLTSCPKNDDTGKTTTWSGDQVLCQYEYGAAAALPGARWSTAAGDTCTRRPQDTTNYSQSQIRCQYAATADSPIDVADTGLSSCTAYSQSSGSATFTFTGDKKDCVYDGSTAWAPAANCTKRNLADFSNTKVSCRYAAEGTATTETSCTRNNHTTTNLTDLSGTTTGDKVRCEWRDYGAWGGNPLASCTWNNPADVSSTGRECRYLLASTSAPSASCTPNPRDGTGSTAPSGTTWGGPSRNECAYVTTPVVDTNLTTCSPTGTNNGTNRYTTCDYGAIVNAGDLTSCTVDPTEPGPNFSNGSTRACFYQTTAYSSGVKTTCNQVAQAADFSAPQVTCTYAAAVTVTNLTDCTNKSQSGANPFEGPAMACAYATTPSSTTDVTACNAFRQTASPYTGGAAVDCSYSATGVTTPGVASCTEQAETPFPGPNYVGPRRVCSYDTASTSNWTDVTSGQCDVVTQAGPSFQGPARECRYRALPDNPADNACASLEVPQSTGPSYTVRIAKQCDNSTFVSSNTTATTTVDSCSTTPTSVTDVYGVVTATATTCTYQAGTPVNTPACVERAQDATSPYTKAVACPITDVTQAIQPDCSATGALPDVFDASGTIVVCSRTDVKGTEGVPEPVADCLASVNGVTKEQTTCTPLIDTAQAVATCTPIDPPTGPSFIKRTCPTTVTTSTSMGCKPETADASNGYRTVTCAAISGTGTRNTLADVAIYYYNTDLRTHALGNCTGVVVPPATAGNNLCSNAAPDPLNNVPTTTTDTRAYQHMTTFTLGLGASGYMKYIETYEADGKDFLDVKGNAPHGSADGITADPANGVCSWQSANHCNWPFPDAGEQTTIDDLWHAGVNGRGGYFNASDPRKLGEAITSALNKVEASSGAAAAPTISSPRLAPADNYIFSSTYTSADWTGEIRRYQIDPFTGVVSTEVDWSVAAKLNAKVSRNIYTFDSSVASTKLKAFNATNFGSDSRFNMPHISTAPDGLSQFLCASQEPCLPAAGQTAAAGANLVNFLAGDRTHEGKAENNAKYFRERANPGVLGDMVNAQVVYVTKPLYEYGDPGYSTFKGSQASRQAVVYAGANDGMLHAFAAKGSAATEALIEDYAAKYAAWFKDQGNQTKRDDRDAAKVAANAALGADLTVAQEMWAYIPTKVMPHLYKLADKLYRNDGKHRYYVDATPIVGDVCVSSCGGAGAVWKTMLVGGLGRGGRGYYALDITDPTNPKAMWEFSDDNLGYSYGNPQITKMSDGRWVVLVTSGYNNIPNEDGAAGDGVGRLFVLDAATGVQVAGVSPISTGAGSVADPSGLSKITAQVRNPLYDNTIVAVYGGDLLGNLWRFDVNGDVGTSGIEAQLLATLKDGSNASGGKSQPITSKPEIGLIEDKVVVFVGTGRLLAGEDIGDGSLQTMYAIKDTGAGTAPSQTTPVFDNPGGERTATSPQNANASGFVRQIQSEITCPTGSLPSVCASGETIVTSTNHPVSFASQNGWFVDMIHAAERMSTDPVLALGILAFNTNVPSLLACDVDGKSYSYALDYRTGGPLYYPGNGTPSMNNGMVGNLLSNSFASSPALVVTQSGAVKKISGTPGLIISEDVNPAPGITPARRTSWRELIETN